MSAVNVSYDVSEHAIRIAATTLVDSLFTKEQLKAAGMSAFNLTNTLVVDEKFHDEINKILVGALRETVKDLCSEVEWKNIPILNKAWKATAKVADAETAAIKFLKKAGWEVNKKSKCKVTEGPVDAA